jgi:type IV pilus assembly protein PilE
MQRQAGFTLIELMITMVVLAILSAIAIPSYTDYIRRGKIPEATSNLQAMKTKMEQFFQDNRSYPTAGCVTAPTAPVALQIQVPQLQHFTITCPNANLSANTYQIVATGGVASGDQSLAGIVYTVDQSNNRTTTVTSGSTMAKAGYTGNANCWVTRKGGTC